MFQSILERITRGSKFPQTSDINATWQHAYFGILFEKWDDMVVVNQEWHQTKEKLMARWGLGN